MFFLPSAAYAIPGTWRGYAFTDGSAAATGTVVSAYLNNITPAVNASVGEVTSWPAGYYLINVEGASGDKVNFKVCGINVSMPSQDWSIGLHPNTTTDSPYINLSVTKLASGASCTYSCGCPSNYYCCSGATEYTAGTGTGTCQASVCAAATTTTTAAPSPSGGGPAATTTTTPVVTTTTLPPIEKTTTIGSIAKESTGTFSFTELVVSDIEVSAKNDVTNPRLTVSQSSAVPAAAATAAPNTVYGYITVKKANVADADVSSVKVKFKVPKEWITGSSIDESTITLMRYNNTWASLPTTKLSEDATYVYYEATSPGLSEFAITGKKAVTTTTGVPTTTVTTTLPGGGLQPGDYTIIIAVIVLIAAIALVFWKFKLVKL